MWAALWRKRWAEQEDGIIADVEEPSQAGFSSAELEALLGLMSAEEGSGFPLQPLL